MFKRSHLLAVLALAFTATGCPSPDPVDPGADAQHVEVADAAVVEADAAPDAAADAAADAAPDAPDAEPEPDQPDPNPTFEGCATWHYVLDSRHPEGTVTTAAIDDGALVLSSEGDGDGISAITSVPGGAIALYQKPLRGDFDVVVEVDGLEGAEVLKGLTLFASTDAGMYSSFIESAITDRNLVTSEHGAFGHGTSWSTFASTTRATLRLQRVGNNVTASGVAGDDVVTPITASMSGDVMVGLSLDAQAPRLTARIASVTVTGGGDAVQSDSFDCAPALP